LKFLVDAHRIELWTPSVWTMYQATSGTDPVATAKSDPIGWWMDLASQSEGSIARGRARGFSQRRGVGLRCRASCDGARIEHRAILEAYPALFPRLVAVAADRHGMATVKQAVEDGGGDDGVRSDSASKGPF
jgi:hypothetical protein